MLTVLVVLWGYGEILLPAWAICWVLGMCLIPKATESPRILAISLWVILTFMYGAILVGLTWALYHHKVHFTWHVSGPILAISGVVLMIVSVVPVVYAYRLERKIKVRNRAPGGVN